MRSPLRIEPFLRGIETVWREHPDMRFGQLLMNIAGHTDTWHWENSDWSRAIEEFRVKYASPTETQETSDG